MKETAYLLQAALISAWWIGLASSPSFFAAFQFDGIPPKAFWSFFAPDVLFLAVLSLIRSYRKSGPLDFLILGAFGYASLYCVNASVLTGSGFLASGLMLLGLAYNVFLCFNQSLFSTSTSSTAQNAVKTGLQIACVWVLALGVVPYILLDAFGGLDWPAFGVRFGMGCLLFITFSALGLSGSYVMVRDGKGTPLPTDQSNRLVVTGPYRFVRNPMALAGIGQACCVALVFHSLPIFLYAALGAVIWQLVVRPIEERDMERRFGGAYAAYRDRVSCWIPSFPGRES